MFFYTRDNSLLVDREVVGLLLFVLQSHLRFVSFGFLAKCWLKIGSSRSPLVASFVDLHGGLHSGLYSL